VLSFSGHVLYASYQSAPRLWGISALDDQAAAGAIMWVPGSLAFLVPAAILGIRALESNRSEIRAVRATPKRSPRAPIVSRVLRYRHFRRCLQITMFLLAGAVIADGLAGTQVAPMNLAGVLPWIYWRALAVIALLVAGNLFCMACPFTMPRDLGRRFVRPR
jgi:hypothetical protein